MFWSKTYQFRRDKQCFTQKHVNFEEIINVLSFLNIYLLHLLTKWDFSSQYFYCLPHKTSELDFHSIVKMISESRRIFFALFIQKSIFGLSIYISIYCLSHKAIYNIGTKFLFSHSTGHNSTQKNHFHFWTQPWKALVEISLFRMSNRL